MWLAARLDRLALVKELAGAGVPLSIKGYILNDHETLLVAAARGAAVTVGKWLIHTQNMPVNADTASGSSQPGRSPLAALMAFERMAGPTPRAKAFLHVLISNGASKAGLSAQDKQALHQLLEQPDASSYGGYATKYCVAPTAGSVVR